MRKARNSGGATCLLGLPPGPGRPQASERGSDCRGVWRAALGLRRDGHWTEVGPSRCQAARVAGCGGSSFPCLPLRCVTCERVNDPEQVELLRGTTEVHAAHGAPVRAGLSVSDIPRTLPSATNPFLLKVQPCRSSSCTEIGGRDVNKLCPPQRFYAATVHPHLFSLQVPSPVHLLQHDAPGFRALLPGLPPPSTPGRLPASGCTRDRERSPGRALRWGP